MGDVLADLVFVSAFVGFVVALGLLIAWITGERMPWQHAERCACGRCYARRMKRAVEQAEYEIQQQQIRRAVDEMERASRSGRQ